MASDLAMILLRSMEKGETLEKAKTSLLNAGYSLQDVQNAVNEVQNLPKQQPQAAMAKAPAAKQVIQTQRTFIQTTQVIPQQSAPQPVLIQQAPQAPPQQPKQPLLRSTKTDFAFIFLVLFIIIVVSGAITTGVFFQQIKASLFG